MKKLIALLLLSAMALSLCACGEAEVTEEQVAEVVEAVEEALPAVEELVAQAQELFYSGDYSQLFSALGSLEDSGAELVEELLGICHYYGYGTEIDADKAVEILEESSGLIAKYIRAEAARTGNGGVQNPDKAQELYAQFVSAAEEAAELSGSVYAALSACYANGLGTELDPDEAMYCADKAIAAGGLAVFEKAELAAYILQQAEDAIDRIEAELNESGYGIADLNDESKTVYMTDPDSFKARLAQIDSEKAKAAQLCTEAMDGIKALAEKGNVIALKLMGDYYFGALGGEAQDYEKAMEYYMQAADYDYAPAQAQIALMYQDGCGVEVDYAMAMEWNNRAAQQGNPQGQAQIGYLYHMGLGVTQNLDEAGRWYSRAADQGDTWAAAKLAETEITNPQLAFEFHA